MPKGVYERQPGVWPKCRRKKPYYPPKSGWGRRKYITEPPSYKDNERLLKYRCDKFCREINERLIEKVKVYTNEEYSQEFLKSLVDVRNL